MSTTTLSIGNIIAYLALQEKRNFVQFEHSFIRNIARQLHEKHPSIIIDCDKYDFDSFRKINKNITDWGYDFTISDVLSSTYSSLYKLLPNDEICGWIDEEVEELYKEIEEIFGD